MQARYILGALAVVLLLAGLWRVRRLGLAHPQVRTWLLVAHFDGDSQRTFITAAEHGTCTM